VEGMIFYMGDFSETQTITFKHLLLCAVENISDYNIKQTINNPLDVVEVLNTIYKISHLPEEIFVAIFLDCKNKINGITKISHGTAVMTPVSTRDLYKNALAHNATQLLVAHNHPTGNPTPSVDDIKVTNALKKAGEFLDIALVDHIIIGDGQYYSFTENKQINSGVRLAAE
jgi:DNA repair protein RadC